MRPDFYIVVPARASGERGSAQMIGRLQAGASIDNAQADLLTIANQRAQERPWPGGQHPVLTVYPARALVPELALPAAIFAGVLLSIVGLALLIACVNIANLLLARSAERQREIAVRVALGASRGRLIRQLLTESVVLSVTGGLMATGVALVTARSIAAAAIALPSPVPIALEFVSDWRLVLAATALSVLTTLAFGVVPAFRASKREILPALKQGAVVGDASRSRLRGTFVAAQVSMSTLLLVVAALLVRGLVSARTLDRGFVTDGVITASLDLQSAGYEADGGIAFYESLLDRLYQTPVVAAATIVDIVPLTLSNRADAMVTEGHDPGDAPNSTPLVYRNSVSRSHFRTLGIPMLAGRDFDARDRADAAAVGIINDSLARRFWPGESPLGKRLRPWNGGQSFGPWVEVVGVVRDSKYVTIGEAPKLFLYRPLAQAYTPRGNVVIRASSNPADALTGLRSAIASLDPNVAVFNIMTLEAATSLSLLPVKVAATVAGVLGCGALLLGAIGIYGVISYLTRHRTREIGLRIALGADPSAVVRLVAGDGMQWTAIGMTIGLLAALGVGQLLKGFLYGVSGADPQAFVGIVLLLGATAYAACYVPARRASQIDPLTALREE